MTRNFVLQSDVVFGVCDKLMNTRKFKVYLVQNDSLVSISVMPRYKGLLSQAVQRYYKYM